ncbi:hypothetical protein ElyMa_006529200 [Elysia marginata]|uniref:Uncharacterized protein n=1 Tax=Elysia marginata TaxID=1093978 RepID=A0AAV4I7A1_9GAST|nr:hypothetical protein ElyMa_006529200 [Elysia marginata]
METFALDVVVDESHTHTQTHLSQLILVLEYNSKDRPRRPDGENKHYTGRQADKQTDRKTDRCGQMEKCALQRQACRQTDRKIDRDRWRE